MSTKMTYNWESGAIFELIDMYRERPALWDADHEDYRDRSKKGSLWEQIAAHFGVERHVVERKMKILVSQYRRELQRCHKGEESKWYAFKRLSFLKATSSVHCGAGAAVAQHQNESEDELERSDEESTDNMSWTAMNQYAVTSPVPVAATSQTPLTPSTSATHHRLPSQEFVAPPQLIHQILPTSEPDMVPRKRSRCSAYGTNKMLKIICRDRKYRDEFAVFGEHVANKLRNIDNVRARNTAQFHINNILYNAEMGKYDGDTPNQKRANEKRRKVSQRDQNPLSTKEDGDGLDIEPSDDSPPIFDVRIKEEVPPY